MHIRSLAFASFAVAIAIASILPSAAAAQGRVRGLARFGLEHGGEKVIEFEYEDGSTPDVTAGGGVLLSVGAVAQAFASGAHAVDAQVNLGFKWRTIPAASNQDANWMRFPLEGLIFYRAPKGFRLGAGATVHLANALKSSGDVLDEKLEFKATPGFILQAEYLNKNVGFDLRYTALEYDLDTPDSLSIDASSIGLGMSFFFGRSAPATQGRTAR